MDRFNAIVEDCAHDVIPINALSKYLTKEELLTSLVSEGAAKYKRYKGLPLRYAGGKSLAVGHVVEHLPSNLDKLVSPFFGGGAIEIAVANKMGVEVQGYDVFKPLANFWQIILTHPEKLASTISKWKSTKQEYEAVKSRLKAHWKGEKNHQQNVASGALLVQSQFILRSRISRLDVKDLRIL